MRRAPRFLLLLSLLVSAGASLASTQASAAATSSPTPSSTARFSEAGPDQAFIGKQLQLMQFRSWVASRPGVADSGYVESVDDPAALAVTLLWHGASALRAVVLAEGNARSLAVDVKEWPYSKQQIAQATTALLRTTREDPAWAGFEITGIVGLDPERPGLTIEGNGAGGVPISAAAKQLLTQRARVASGVEVSIVDGAQHTLASTRSTDTSPFYAGGFMKGNDGGGCSSGFGYIYGGVSRVSTARHCRSYPFKAYDLSSSSYGSLVVDVAGGQASLLTGNAGGRVFTGPWTSSTTATVVGWRDVGPGDYVCASGGNSGLHCNIKVTAMDWGNNDGISTELTIKGVNQTTGAVAAQGGDSGGPIYVAYGSSVYAVGMIQWVGDYVTCGSTHAGGRCGNSVGWTSAHTILNNLGSGASLVTG